MSEAWYEDLGQYDKPVSGFPLPRQSCAVLTYEKGGTTTGWRQGGWRDNSKLAVYPDANSNLRRFVTANRWGLIMESTGLCCIDIDDHSGQRMGFKSISHFDMPPTLAKRSRSGKGRHLYYWLPKNLKPADYIGILPEVDFKGKGITFFVKDMTLHNGLPPVYLPDGFARLVQSTQKKTEEKTKAMFVDAKNGLQRMDCPSGCYEPIPPGTRNDTLNAWGFGLMCNDWPNWDQHVVHRGKLSGMPDFEIETIVRSIRNAI